MSFRSGPNEFLNRLSFHFDSDDDDDDGYMNGASPGKPLRRQLLAAKPDKRRSERGSDRGKDRGIDFGRGSDFGRATESGRATEFGRGSEFSRGSDTSRLSQAFLPSLDMPPPLFSSNYMYSSARNSEHSLPGTPMSLSELDSESDMTESDVTSANLSTSSLLDPPTVVKSRPLASGFLDGSTPLASGLRTSRFHRVNHSTIGIAPPAPTVSEFSSFLGSAGGGEVEYSDDDSPERSPQRQRVRGPTRRPLWMPATKVRRTHSMFATPEQLLGLGGIDGATGNVDVAAGAANAAGAATSNTNTAGSASNAAPPSGPHDLCTGVLEKSGCPVPTFRIRQDPFPRISAATLCRLLDREFGALYEAVVVVDCRFEYEFEGGHIDGAINVNSKQQLEQTMFHRRLERPQDRVLLVFHCEYSAYRSPKLAGYLRHCDRELNAHRYPSLFYPDVAVLDGGYSDFYDAAAHRCVPQNYVAMDHQAHQNTCEREMTRFRSGMRSLAPSKRGAASVPDLTADLSSFRFPSIDALGGAKSASSADLPLKSERSRRT